MDQTDAMALTELAALAQDDIKLAMHELDS